MIPNIAELPSPEATARKSLRRVRWHSDGEREAPRPACAVPQNRASFAQERATDRIPPKARYIDAEEAAVFLGGLNSRTVVRWAREGYLTAYPIGEGKRRMWRFLVSDLEVWMTLRRTGTLITATGAPIGGLVN